MSYKRHAYSITTQKNTQYNTYILVFHKALI